MGAKNDYLEREAIRLEAAQAAYDEHDCTAGPEDGCAGCQAAVEAGIIPDYYELPDED